MSKLFIIPFFIYSLCFPAGASLVDVDKAFLPNLNILLNPGFENGRASWTASAGTFSTATSGSNLLLGKVSATWDSSGAGQTLTSTAVTIPNGLRGQNGLAYCRILTPSGTATHTLSVFDGTNTLVSQTITSSTSPTRTSVNFIFPSSGSLSIRLTSVAADEPLISIDDCYLGMAANLTNVSQASIVGESYIAATTNCQWTRSSTTVGQFGTDADCPGPTVVRSNIGTWLTTDSDLPRQSINNLPPGDYEVTIIPMVAMSVAQSMSLAISDGTTTCEPQGGNANAAGSVGVSVTCVFSYTTAGNRFFELYAGSPTVTVNLNNNTTGPRTSLKFIVKRFPSSDEQALRPSQTANSWSGYHANTCTWSRTNTALGAPADDATCSLVENTNQNFGTVSTSGSVSPAITFTPSRAGRYYVCAHSGLSTTATNSILTSSLTDGSTVIAQSQVRSYNGGGGVENGPFVALCGVYVVTSTAARTLSIQTASSTGAVNLGSASVARGAIEWSIFQIDQTFPAPVLIGSVTSPSSGAMFVCTGFILNSGSTSISRSDGNCFASVNDNGTGDTTINLTAGTFSSTPNCSCTVYSDDGQCSIDSTTAISSSLVRTQTRSAAGSAADKDHFVMCIGPR